MGWRCWLGTSAAGVGLAVEVYSRVKVKVDRSEAEEEGMDVGRIDEQILE